MTAHLSAENRARAEALVALYPQPRSALVPLCHLAQAQDGWLCAEAMEEIAELCGTTPAEVYVAVESPRGELGCYLVSDGSNRPMRMHIRAPSFANIQAIPAMLRGGLIADMIAILSSVDPVLGDVDR